MSLFFCGCFRSVVIFCECGLVVFLDNKDFFDIKKYIDFVV